jgi:hypothetical protein
VVALALLVYLGVALAAVWSAKPARRKAAADVLRQILNAFTCKQHQLDTNSAGIANSWSSNSQ